MTSDPDRTVYRGTARSTDDTGTVLTARVQSYDDPPDDIEVVESYGLSVRPPDGSEVVVCAVEGDSGLDIVIKVANRNGRPKNLEKSDVCLWSAHGGRVFLKGGGVDIEPPAGKPVRVLGGDVQLGDGASVPLTKWTDLQAFLDQLLVTLGTGTVATVPIVWGTPPPPVPSAGTTKITGV